MILNTINKEKKLIIFFCLAIIIIHSFFSRFHFHETDSAIVFYKLNLDSNDFFFNIKGHVEKTSLIIFYPIRFFLGILSDYLPLQPLRSAIRLSLTTTYPFFQGFIYGIYNPRSFEYFYRYSSLVNIICLLISLYLLYLSNKKFGKLNLISFLFSFGSFFLYQVNAYSYHLGSTNWYFCASCLSIYSIIFLKGIRKDLILLVSILSSYPNLLFWIINFMNDYINRSKHRIILKSKNYRFNIFKDLLAEYKYSSFTFISTIILFYPFGENQRGIFDWRGIFTPFSFLPLYTKIDLWTYLTAIILISLFFIAAVVVIFRLNYSEEIDSKQNQQNILLIALSYLLVIFLLISINILTLSTTRHLLFILPYILFLTNYSAQIILKKISLNFKTSINTFLIALLTIMFFLSTYSTFLRLDPLKVKALPQEIINFQLNSTNDNSISAIEGGIHLQYNDFTNFRATYNKSEPYKILPLTTEGKRLIVAQRPSKAILNYRDDLRKGDYLKTKFEKLEIKLMENPFVVENKIYFDSLNFDEDTPDNQSNGYSRPNSIYIYPVEIKSVN